MSNDIIPVSPSAFAIMPVMEMSAVIERRNALVGFVKAIMVADTDYGRVPGTSKDTLLKPGAEKLVSFFGLTPVFDDVTVVEDWTGAMHNGEAFLFYREKCKLYRGEMLVATADGSANSWEEKYRYRRSERACPICNTANIMRSKYPPRDNPNADPATFGWYCNKKSGGCGANYPATDPAIVNQEAGKVVNPNPADLANTILKMSQKRALVAATLLAVNASEFFTQDVEDMTYIETTYRVVDEATGEVTTPVKTVAKGKPAPVSGNGAPAAEGEYRSASENDTDPLIALWTSQAKNFAHAPNVVNGQWGAVQAVLTGICGGREARLAFYGQLFGRTMTTGEDLTAAERSWLHAYVKPFADKGTSNWHANQKAEGEIVAFLMRHPSPEGQAQGPAPTDAVLVEAAADNPESKHAQPA